MTDESGVSPCDAFSVDLAELALGILTGRERAAALAHVDTLPALRRRARAPGPGR